MGWTDKFAGEHDLIGFDYKRELAAGEAIVSASFEASDAAGKDAAPQNIIVGAAVINGSVVKQYVDNLVAGARYIVVATVETSSGRKLIDVDAMRVLAPGE